MAVWSREPHRKIANPGAEKWGTSPKSQRGIHAGFTLNAGIQRDSRIYPGNQPDSRGFTRNHADSRWNHADSRWNHADSRWIHASLMCSENTFALPEPKHNPKPVAPPRMCTPHPGSLHTWHTPQHRQHTRARRHNVTRHTNSARARERAHARTRAHTHTHTRTCSRARARAHTHTHTPT